MMSNAKKAILGTAAVLGAIVLVGTVSWFRFSRSFQRDLSPAAIEPFETTLKKAASDFVVIKRRNNSSSKSAPPQGYLVAYEQNRESFKADAKLFDTWLVAVQLATSVLKQGPNGNWVESSSKIEYVNAELRVDPWGHSLCLLRRGNAVLVISGGPNVPGSPTCEDVRMTHEELAKFPANKLLQSPSGSLILVVDQEHSSEALPSSK
jgi:hypothetical protein